MANEQWTIVPTGEVTGLQGVPVSQGGTGKTSWTKYCIPYLSDTTIFGEIPIGSANQYFKVNATATGYEFGEPTQNLLSASHPDTISASSVLGDLIIGNATPKWERLAGNITTTRKFLSQTGTGTISAVPVWNALVDGDIPTNIVRDTRQILVGTGLTGGGNLQADRTISLTVPVAIANGGTGLSALGTANQLLGVNTGATALEYKTLSGTANQINVTPAAGSITLSTPQDIHSGASPTFAGLTLSSLTAGSILFAGTNGILSQDNTNLFWDNTNKRLGMGTTTPDSIFVIKTNQVQARIRTDVSSATNTVAGFWWDGDNSRRVLFNALGSAISYTSMGKSWSGNAILDSSWGTELGINMANVGIITFGTSNVERMRIVSNGDVGIGTTSPNSILHINGSIATAYALKTANYTVSGSDSIITGDATSASFTITLPTAVGITGRKYSFIRIDNSPNTITLDGNGTETINGVETKVLSAQWARCEIISDGSNWIIIGE
ncbi:MAG: hypothetical protein AB1567_11940 [bacterium]